MALSTNCPRMLITALAGGGGKTLLSLGLCQAIQDLGYIVQPYKKGPDYIDAAWLSRASGRAVTNLDPFWLNRDALRTIFMDRLAHHTPNTPICALVEGNRGLFDGLDIYGSASSAELARALNLPIVLSIDCTKMTRTAAAIVLGVENFDPKLFFLGVILNKVGTIRQEELLRKTLATYTDLPVLGCMPRLPINLMPERHMGLASQGPRLAEDIAKRLYKLRGYVKEYIDVAKVVKLAVAYAQENPLERPKSVPKEEKLYVGESAPVIGVVRDACLWFYYPENLEALKISGAQVIELSLLGEEGKTPWPHLSGLYLGGGFPEDYVMELGTSKRLMALLDLAKRGLPIYAECGGFMLLAKSLLVHGKKYHMAQVFDVEVEFCARPCGLGYTEAEVIEENPYLPKGISFKGHEFHYSRCVRCENRFTLSLQRGSGMQVIDKKAYDGLQFNNVFAAYTHIFAPAVPCWAPNFVKIAATFSRKESVR